MRCYCLNNVNNLNYIERNVIFMFKLNKFISIYSIKHN